MTRAVPVALITGAASGIGRQLALDLGQDGYAIAALDLQPAGLQALAEELARRGVRHAWAAADVTDAAATAAAAAELEAKLGPIELLIASAGIGRETSGLDYRAADVAKVISVNLIGVSNTIAAVLPGMLARRRGHIAALSSVASFRGLPRMIAYSASKAGVNALLDGLRTELHDQGIAVTTLCPGWVRTPMTDQIKGKLRPLLEVAEASRHIRQALRHRRPFCAFPRGMALRLRLLTWLPRPWQDRLIRGMLARLRTDYEPEA